MFFSARWQLTKPSLWRSDWFHRVLHHVLTKYETRHALIVESTILIIRYIFKKCHWNQHIYIYIYSYTYRYIYIYWYRYRFRWIFLSFSCVAHWCLATFCGFGTSLAACRCSQAVATTGWSAMQPIASRRTSTLARTEMGRTRGRAGDTAGTGGKLPWERSMGNVA